MKVGPGVVDEPLHLPDQGPALADGRERGLPRVHLVVGGVAEPGVAPAAVLGAGDHRQHEVRVDRRDPVPHRHVEGLVLVVRRGDRGGGGVVVQVLLGDHDPDLLEVGLQDRERPVAGTAFVRREDHLVGHGVAVGDPHAVRAHLVAGLVEQLVGLGQVERERLDCGSCHWPSEGATIVLPGWAKPSQAILMISARSVAYSSASRTSGFSSSRWTVLWGLVLMMKSFIDRLGRVSTTRPRCGARRPRWPACTRRCSRPGPAPARRPSRRRW